MLKGLTLWLLACSLSLGAVSTVPTRGLNQTDTITIAQCENKIVVYSICSSDSDNVNKAAMCVTSDTISKEIYKNRSGSSIKNVVIFMVLKGYEDKDCVAISSNKPTRSDIAFVDRLKEKQLSFLVRHIKPMDITIQQVNEVIQDK